MFSDTLLVKPGHLIRRVHQRSVAIFSELARPYGITPVQHVVMVTVRAEPGIDLSTLSERVNLDKATIGSVVRRLVERGLVRAETLPNDKRAKCIVLTEEGEALSRTMRAIVDDSQQRVLAPLSRNERTQFFKIMRKLIGEAPEVSQDEERPPAAVPGDGAGSAVVLGVDRVHGRAFAERAAEQNQSLTLLARDGGQAADLANVLRLRGTTAVESRSCLKPDGSEGEVSADVLTDIVSGADFVAFIGWGEDGDAAGPLAVDLQTLQSVLQALAATRGGTCVLCSALAHLAPELNRLWEAQGVYVTGVAVDDGIPVDLLVDCVDLLGRRGAASGGEVLSLRSPSAGRRAGGH